MSKREWRTGPNRRIEPRKRGAATATNEPDGLTDWQRRKVAYMASVYQRRFAPMKPMTSIRGLSPAFSRLAIRLEVALAEYRDVAGEEVLLRKGFRHHGIPDAVIDAGGRAKSHVLLAQAFDAERAAKTKVHGILTQLRETPPIKHGDRRLQAYAPNIQNCNFYRQLDWAYDDWVYSRRTSWDGLTEN
jgi:hypothetical protein